MGNFILSCVALRALILAVTASHPFLFVLHTPAATPLPSNESAALAAVAFEDGDRVVWLGGTFVERMQRQNDLETLITAAYPGLSITFRNLGWSGDNVWGESRALFGKPDDGFVRLLKDVSDARPTMIVIAYGANEAHAGPAGIEPFLRGLHRLLDALVVTQARIVLLGGHRRESLGGRLPSQNAYNASLDRYNQAAREVARQRNCGWISLQDLVAGGAFDPSREPPDQQLTRDGVHLTDRGYWISAPRIARHFSVPIDEELLTIDVDERKSTLTGERAATGRSRERALQVERTPQGIEFQFAAASLPYPSTWNDGGARAPAPDDNRGILQTRLRVVGLPPGDYRLRIDQQWASELIAARDWSAERGIVVENQTAALRYEQLRAEILEKNALFFHRYRPQNETYLFLFRRHEQGNNAVEIPQFDPLIAEREQRIAALRRPAIQQFELIRGERNP
ncbi:MAG: SGNH/GDSL hydrolase family protein [Planctomycetes bacterium]|nr:SGNH/GDSL hydrolase family protein [Planctomycetota bacterium]